MKTPSSAERLLLSFLFALVIVAGPASITAGVSPKSDVAIKGYDAVAYFLANKAIKGNESFSFQWHNLTWYFLSEKNRDMFVTSPEKYAPQYDGYCAWAMTEERKAITDPEVWKIVDGKLYLNCSMAAYEKWIRDIPGNISKADSNWLKLISK